MQTEYAVKSYGCRASTMESHQNVIERSILAMRENIGTNFPLECMARSAMCSPFHFDRVFRQMMGLTPSHFLSALRVQEAKRLLLTTSLSVIDVCFEAGYNSLGAFTTRFTQMVGLPPNRLRKLGSQFKDVDQLLEKLPAAAPHEDEPSVRGIVTAAEDFDGVVFIGLFKGPIPQGSPVSCTIMKGPGEFQLPTAPDGSYFVFAAGQPFSEPALSYLVSDKMLRGSSGPVALNVKQGSAPCEVEIRLRHEQLTDPPILLAMPLLVDLHRGNRGYQSVSAGI
jgi:AraC family transcriptional regulator